MSSLGLTAKDTLALIAEQIGRLGPAVCRIGGSVRFLVPGGGDWILRLDKPSGRWTEANGETDANATIIIPEAHFSDLLMAPDKIAGLIERGIITITGDAGKLAALGELLTSQGPIQKQLGSGRRFGKK
jgi:hypothetical protein